MIGNFKPNVDKHVFTTSVCVTTDSREGMYQNIKKNSTFIKHFEHPYFGTLMSFPCVCIENLWCVWLD